MPWSCNSAERTGEETGMTAAASRAPALPRVPEPTDFDSYWAAVAAELDHTDVAPELELIPLRSSAEVHVYALRFTSSGPYRLFAYYATPAAGAAERTPGRPPGVEVRLPGY